MKRMGVVLTAQGAPLADRSVTVRDWATGAPVTTLTTNAQGRWEIDLPDETKQYWIDTLYGGSSTQMTVQTPASIELEHLFVRHGAKLPAGTLVGGVAVDTSFVNVSGDTMTGELTIDSVAPTFSLRESDAPPNNRVVKLLQPSGDGRLRIQAYTDAGVGGTSFLDLIRSGSNLTEMRFGGNVVIAGNLTVDNIVNGNVIRRNGEDVWGPDNDGPDSGLNADSVDGQSASIFARVASGAYSGTNVVNGHIATTFLPKLVMIQGNGGGFTEAYTVIDADGSSRAISHDDINPYHIHGFEAAVAVTSTPSYGFRVNINGTGAANHTGCTYWWVAIGAG